MNWRHLLFGLDGRIGRQRFWIALSIITLVGFGLSFPVGDLLSAAELPARWQPYLPAILMAYPASAVVIKRLHDRNRPGRWITLVWVPGLLVFLGRASELAGTWTDVYGTAVFLPNSIGWFLYGTTVAVGLGAALELGCFRGTVGDNAFGADPLRYSKEAGV